MSRNFYENKPYSDEPRKFPNDARVVISEKSPIWGKYSGTIVGFNKGLHHVMIDTRPSGNKTPMFTAEIPGSDLEECF